MTWNHVMRGATPRFPTMVDRRPQRVYIDPPWEDFDPLTLAALTDEFRRWVAKQQRKEFYRKKHAR